MASGELIDAREAMQLLGIGENDLQTYVARGDLRAFRSAGTMKFRRDDVLTLKTDKGTEPTIIIPATEKRKPGQSGILQSVPAAPQAKAPDATGPIVFDDIDLAPQDPLGTQQATVVSSAITGPAEATVVDQAITSPTGEMTVLDSVPDEAKIPTGQGQPVKRPSQRVAPAASPVAKGSSVGPAVSRIKQPAVAVARRTATVYERKTFHPIMTAIILLTSIVCLYALSILSVMAVKGHYDYNELTQIGSKERIIPPYLKDVGVFWMYTYNDAYRDLPGMPQDIKPPGEPEGKKNEP